MGEIQRPEFWRHAAFVGPAVLNGTMTIIGCGATGSHIALLAAKMGFTKFELWDLDLVEAHNLPNQTYEPKHIGKPKVEALTDVLTSFNPAIEVISHREFFTTESEINSEGPVVLTTDTMKSRKEIIAVCKDNFNVDSLFETRLGFHHGEVAVVDVLDDNAVETWEASLVNDEDVPDGPCNARICTTLVQLIAAFTVHQICEMYSSRNNNTQWKYNQRTIIQMNPALTVYAI